MPRETTSKTANLAGAGLLTIQFIALVYAVVALAGGVIAVVESLSSATLELTLPATASLPASVLGNPDAVGQARVVGGQFTQGSASIADLGLAPRALHAAGSGILALTAVTVALALAYFCWKLHKRQPFMAATTRAVTIAAAALLAGGFTGQALLGFSTWTAIDQLGLDQDLLPLSIQINLLPVAAGIALAIVATAFQLGERMQRDTEGLV